MLLIGSSIHVAPITQWDGRPVGDGKPGPVGKALLALIEKDMLEGREQLIPIAYR